jgi:SAM-dependent methyltransferase
VDFDELMGAVMRMSVELECLAVAGTHLRSTIGAIETDPSIDRSLRDVTALILPGADALPVAQREILAGVIVTMFRQANDLVQNPERPPGWTFDEPTILQSTGRASMSVADVLARIAPQLGDLGDRLAQSTGAFLDVGTGAGWLAIGAAGHWPDARVCGIDIHAPALALAATNVRDAGVADRVELREQDVRTLPDEDAFDLAWLPGPFLPVGVVPAALDACHRAVRPGGWLTFGMYGGPDSTLARQLADLRTIRSGGHPWDDAETAALLTEHGFEDVHEVVRSWHAPVRLMVGRVP